MALTDEEIAKMAKSRVGFKQHAVAYVIINAMLAVIWAVTVDELTFRSYWPVWTHLGWGVGLAFHGANAYGPERAMVAREEERLRAKYGK